LATIARRSGALASTPFSAPRGGASAQVELSPRHA
jgi:hypothetical protein